MFTDGNVTLMVRDMARAIRFYSETLGLRLVKNYGGHYAEIEAPGVKIGLHPSREAPAIAGRGMAIGLRVADLDAAIAALAQRGLELAADDGDRGSRQAHFADPDGHALYLIELKWG